MSSNPQEILPPELELALAHTRSIYRDALRIFFELDLRFARILAGTNEPMLGQMRLAWWRETLAKPLDQRPTGDVVLDGIGKHWVGREQHLVKLVDAWENLLADPPLGTEHARSFAQGRVDAMRGAFADRQEDWDERNAGLFALQWAIADLCTNISLQEERDMLMALAAEQRTPKRLSSPFKGVAVLGALALRSLENGGAPLMEGRSASLTALRAAIIGR